jgi:hypothetical protein
MERKEKFPAPLPRIELNPAVLSTDLDFSI